jgi:hypothetical protein
VLARSLAPTRARWPPAGEVWLETPNDPAGYIGRDDGATTLEEVVHARRRRLGAVDARLAVSSFIFAHARTLVTAPPVIDDGVPDPVIEQTFVRFRDPDVGSFGFEPATP